MRRASAGGYAGVVLGLVTDALDAVAVGNDPRPLVCCALGDALGADVAGFVSRERGVRRVTVSRRPVESPDSAAAVLAQQMFRRACDVAELYRVEAGPTVDSRVAWLPVPPAGHGPDLHVFVRIDGFGSDTLMLLRYAQAPAGAVERVFRRTAPPASVSAAPVTVLEGPPAELTAREQEVLRLLSEGLLARTIAARLVVSPRTVHHHLGSIYAKLGVGDRLSAVLRARGLGLLDSVADGAPASRSAEVGVS